MMINRILEQQKALTQVLSEDKAARHRIPTWQDIDVLESVSTGPTAGFHRCTLMLVLENYVSVSYVKQVLHLLNTSMLLMHEEDTDLTKTSKKEMLHYINEKYKDDATQ